MKKFFEKFTKKQLIIMSSIVAFLIVAIIVGTILLVGTECNHIYDNACDSICNECGATRIVAHSYDDSQDPTCNTCGEERVVVHTHVYDNNCDDTCNTCGEARTIEHSYTNTCDKTCNVCGIERVVTHTYDNACDTMCNICGEMQTAEHTYDNDQDETCNVCGFVRDVIHEHVYDNACDSSCNTCGNERTPANHVYTNDEDVDCDVCGFVRDLACIHEYDNNCDTTCNKCNDIRVVDAHVYDNACDETCNICKYERVPDEHVYTNDDDVTCNVCGYNRVIVCKHAYDNTCDDSCNLCGMIRQISHVFETVCSFNCSICGAVNVKAHVYDNACDTTCNECNNIREVDGHVFDDVSDPDCNECGASNPDYHLHIYDNVCDATCNDCGQTREAPHNTNYDCETTCSTCKENIPHSKPHTIENNICVVCGTTVQNKCTHEYEFDCSTACKLCGEHRATIHTYDNSCDVSCNICNYLRMAPHEYNDKGVCVNCGSSLGNHKHVYSNICDDTCNDCGYTRSDAHRYTYDCSITCVVCSAARVANHIDTDNDTNCDYCNTHLTSDADEVKINAFINYFNNYLNTVSQTTNRNDLLDSNIKFSNLSDTGSIKMGLNTISSISVYDNITHYVYVGGLERYVVQTNNGTYCVDYINGKYLVGQSLVEATTHNRTLPSITRNDIAANADGTLSISSSYLMTLYSAWFNSDIEHVWYFGTKQINYATLEAWFAYGNFTNTITIDDKGMITSYDIELSAQNRVLYTASFETSDTITQIDVMLSTGEVANMTFVYTKGTDSSATFNIVFENNGQIVDTVNLSTNITAIEDFTMSNEFKIVYDAATTAFNNAVGIVNKYVGIYTCSNDCIRIAIFDTTYCLYAIFEKEHDSYILVGYANSLDDIEACEGTCSGNVLTITTHHISESIDETLATKYAGQYTTSVDASKIEGIFVYDAELNLYVAFVNAGTHFEYFYFVDVIPEEYMSELTFGTIDTNTKVITIIQ